MLRIKAKAYLSLSGTKLYFEHYPFSVGLANRLLIGGTRRAHTTCRPKKKRSLLKRQDPCSKK